MTSEADTLRNEIRRRYADAANIGCRRTTSDGRTPRRLLRHGVV